MLNIENLSLSIDGHQIFSDVTFTAKSGEILLIKGESGSGKSSLLQVLAGIIPNIYHGDVSGNAYIDESDISNQTISELAVKIAYLMQDPDSQITSQRSFDELIFGLENLNKSRLEIDERSKEIIDLFDLAPIIDKDTDQLSGGQKQRLMLASIASIDPDVYLLDEPTANLDFKSTEEIVKIIDYIAHERGKTVILVEHKVKEFSTIVDTIYEMGTGRFIEENIQEELQAFAQQLDLPKLTHEYSAEKMIEVQDLSFSYEDYSVFSSVSFDIHEGEIVGLVGKNGAGKSTLASLMSGFRPLQSGDILVQGRSLKDFSLEEVGQTIGLVFQNPEQQFVKLTVQEELEISLANKEMAESDKQALIVDYLKKFQLTEYKQANPFQLSQGQKRKLSTAVMLIQGQKFLILDEPTYGQDPTNLNSLMELLLDVSRSGVSILIISHDENVLNDCCHTIIELKNHQLSFCGSAKSYFEEGGVES